jgi:Peptidase family M28
MPAVLHDPRRRCDHPEAMRVTETVAGLAGFERRGPGTDAERRAARWLAERLEHGGRETRIEPFWCRPNWALAHVWHLILAIGGSLLAIPSPWAGTILVLIGLASLLADELFGVSLGRRLTPERASQNVVATARTAPARHEPQVRLIITANYDAGRTGLAYHPIFRSTTARLTGSLHGLTLGWLSWTAIAIVWLLGTSVLRIAGGVSSHAIGAIQIVPAAALLIALAFLVDLAAANPGPAANDNASGTAVALALAASLDAAPPPGVAVDVLLQGAGEGGAIGLRRYLRAHRTELRPADTVVLGIGPSGDGRPSWWHSDGRLVPLRYAPALRELSGRVAADEPHLRATRHSGRGAAPAYLARARRLPAISIGCLDPRGIAPRSHQSSDRADQLDPDALDRALQFGLLLADAIGAFVQRERAGRPSSTPA